MPARPEPDQAVIDAIGDGICIIDGGGRVARINAAMESLFSVERNHAGGMPTSHFFREYLLPALVSPAGVPPDLLASDEVFEMCVDSGDDGHIWLEYSVSSLPHAAGRIALFRRITRWKAAEEHLRLSEERYRLIFNRSYDAILVFTLSADGLPDRFVEVNEAACLRFGYSREDVLSLSPLSLVPPDRMGHLLAVMKGLLHDRSALYKSAQIAADGRIIPVEISSHLVHMGDYPVVISISRDISERQRIDDLKRRAFNQIDANIEQFATLGDHIRNPLAVIVGLSSLEETPSSVRILEAAERIDALVDELDRGWIHSENVRQFLRKHCG
ncbi:PAS domain S-box protein [Methanofollis fontis]|nr:PAS domain S-box protein [Methanofollis fontis]